ncbi:MAG: type II toxin-antitoxin system RelE/ParE family toxin [Candidatus Binataceae bacterium]
MATAIGDLIAVREYIARDNPQSAAAVSAKIRESVRILANFPAAGRVGRISGTRELVIGGTPYVVIYRVRGAATEILRVLHAAQDWPQQ